MIFNKRERRILLAAPRPFRFGLRTIFLVVTVVCVWLAVATWEPVVAIGVMATAGAVLWYRGQIRYSTFEMALGAILVALAVLGAPTVFDLRGRL